MIKVCSVCHLLRIEAKNGLFIFCHVIESKKATEVFKKGLPPCRTKRLPSPWIEHRTFRSSVWRSPNWAIRASRLFVPIIYFNKYLFLWVQVPKKNKKKYCSSDTCASDGFGDNSNSDDIIHIDGNVDKIAISIVLLFDMDKSSTKISTKSSCQRGWSWFFFLQLTTPSNVLETLKEKKKKKRKYISTLLIILIIVIIIIVTVIGDVNNLDFVFFNQ